VIYMKTIVCIKQVPSTNEVRLDPVTSTIIRDGRLSVTNPYDTFSIELAIQIKEKLGGEVIGLSMGIPETERLLRDAMSRGVDRSILLSDRAFAGADTLATAYTLSLGVKTIGAYNLILCGKMAIDGDTGQIGPELAEYLKIPHVTDVKEVLEVNEERVICKKITDKGHQILEVKLPALLTLLKDINLPRLPSILGIRQSLDAPFVLKRAEEVRADTSKIGLIGSPTQVLKTYVPKNSSEAIELKGSQTKVVNAIKDIIGEVN